MARSLCLIETLESRTLLSATLVRLDTNLGNIDVQLTDDVTPVTVANFLNYVNSGRYNNTIFQRNSGNVIQAGAFLSPNFTAIVADAPIVNEFQSGVTTNIRGTIGMAKGSDPNSATDAFFFNLVDNSSSFDNPANSGGFTTFGTIVDGTISTMDAIAAVPVSHNFNPPFDNIPLINYSGSGNPTAANLVIVKHASVLGVFTNTVTLGIGGSKVVKFTDGDGTLTTLSLAGGTGTITFGGSSVFESTSRGVTTVTGTGLSLSNIAVGDSVNAKLSIVGRGGNGSVDLNGLAVTGSMAAFVAPTTHFVGNFNVSSTLGQAIFGSISNSTVTISDGTLPTKFVVLGAIADSHITDVGGIGSFVAGSWSDSSGSASQLTALSVGKLVIPGDLAADLNLTGTGISLASAKLGTVSGGNWFIAGSAAKLAVGSTGGAWAATFSGSVLKFSAGTIQGNLTANAISSLKAGSITGANINLLKPFDGITPALAKLSAGSIINSNIRSTDNIGSISTGSMTGSLVTAGVNFGDNEISSNADFESVATIAAFRSGTFNDSAIIASNVGKVALGLTNDAAPTRAFFGVAANKITSLSAVVINKKLGLKLLDDPAVVPGLIAAQGVTLSNIEIRVV